MVAQSFRIVGFKKLASESAESQFEGILDKLYGVP